MSTVATFGVVGFGILLALAGAGQAAPETGTASPCKLTSASCTELPGTGAELVKLPVGFSLTQERTESPDPGELRRVKIYESAAKPWVGPGGPVGRRIVVITAQRPAGGLTDALDKLPLPDIRRTMVGERSVVTSERDLALRTTQGTRQVVKLSQLVGDLDGRTRVIAAGEGLTRQELTTALASLEVRR